MGSPHYTPLLFSPKQRSGADYAEQKETGALPRSYALLVVLLVLLTLGVAAFVLLVGGARAFSGWGLFLRRGVA